MPTVTSVRKEMSSDRTHQHIAGGYLSPCIVTRADHTNREQPRQPPGLLSVGEPRQPVPRVHGFADHVIRSRAQGPERALMAAIARADCAPPFTVVGLDQMRMPRLRPLTPLIAPATPDERLALARSLLACFERVHAAGICHRDGHRDNFVLDGDRALLIDFELAARVDSGGPCYDLLGPASGIPVPWQHEWLPGMERGV